MGLRVHSFTFNPNIQNTWVQVHFNKRQKLQASKAHSKHPKHLKRLPGTIPVQAGNTPGLHRQRPRNTPAKLLHSCCCSCKAPATLRQCSGLIQSTWKSFPGGERKKVFFVLKLPGNLSPKGKEKNVFFVSKSVDNTIFNLVSCY